MAKANFSPAADRTGSDFGIVEGFYGVFYTFPERNDLIRFAGQHGYNLYVYAPKNDRQHRARWWEAYPAQIMAQFAETVTIAQQSGVRFCYAISPGGAIAYSSPEDFTRLTAKLDTFYALGVRAFSLMLDDNEPGFHNVADARLYGTPAQAQADLANRLYAWLRGKDANCTLSFVPAEYSGRAPFSDYIQNLGILLHPDIALCYTGIETCSPKISTEDVLQFAAAAQRKPLIWDNYPVNDLDMQPELHLAPITGRAGDLLDAVQGILVNPMTDMEASKIPLLTYTAYAADPTHYQPELAWDAALREVAGEAYTAALRTLAENTNLSCLGTAGQRLDHLSEAALQALRSSPLAQALDSTPLQALESYLTEIDEAGYTLKFRLENLALRNNLLPWIEVLEHWMWMTRFALRVLCAIHLGQPYYADLSRVRTYREAIARHPKRIASPALLPLIDFTEAVVSAQVEQEQISRVMLGNVPASA